MMLEELQRRHYSEATTRRYAIHATPSKDESETSAVATAHPLWRVPSAAEALPILCALTGPANCRVGYEYGPQQRATPLYCLKTLDH
jgi:hypothetical protein